MTSINRSTRNTDTAPAVYRNTGIAVLRGNPFAEALGPVPTLDELKAAARFVPPAPEGLTVGSAATTCALLKKLVYKKLFLPTKQQLEVIEQLHVQIRLGYAQRDLRDPKNLPHIYDNTVSGWLGNGEVSLVSGVAGGGKSSTIDGLARTLPQKVLRHGFEIPGIQENALQLPALLLRVEAAQARSTLLKDLLSLHSHLIGFEIPKYSTREPTLADLSKSLSKQLLLRSCGLVMGDEFQWLRSASSGGVPGLQDFVLTLRATGVPTVISCNYDVAEAMCSALNLTRRFGENFFVIHPLSPQSKDWKEIVSTVFQYYPYGLTPAFAAEAPAASFRFTGGIPDLLCKLAVVAYEAPLRERRCLTIDDLATGYMSDKFGLYRADVTALISQNIDALRKRPNLVPPFNLHLPEDVTLAYQHAWASQHTEAYRKALTDAKAVPFAPRYRRPQAPPKVRSQIRDPNDLRNARNSAKPGDIWEQAGMKPRNPR